MSDQPVNDFSAVVTVPRTMVEAMYAPIAEAYLQNQGTPTTPFKPLDYYRFLSMGVALLFNFMYERPAIAQVIRTWFYDLNDEDFLTDDLVMGLEHHLTRLITYFPPGSYYIKYLTAQGDTTFWYATSDIEKAIQHDGVLI